VEGDVREEPETKPHVLSPPEVWRRKREALGSWGTGVGAGLQLSGAAYAVGSGRDHGKTAACANDGARSIEIAHVKSIVTPCGRVRPGITRLTGAFFSGIEVLCSAVASWSRCSDVPS
jgi:hypothetical protein